LLHPAFAGFDEGPHLRVIARSFAPKQSTANTYLYLLDCLAPLGLHMILKNLC